MKISRIAADLKMGEHTIRRHCDLLEKRKCIQRVRTPYGFVIKVLNSRKLKIWHSRERVQNRRVSPSYLADLTVKNGRNKEDAVVDTAIDAATERQPSVWKELGVYPGTLPPEFRELCEGLHVTRDGQPIVKFMSACMDAWESRGNKIPAPFAKAAAEIREREKGKKINTSEVPELEELAWRKK